jgi:hypothetical protein
MGQPMLSGDGGESNWTELKTFYMKVTFGSGAVSSVQTREITSFTRSTNGTYLITLPRWYRTLVEVRCTLVDASGAVYFPVVATDSVATAGTLVLETRTEAGTATDIDSGSKLMIAVVVTNDPFNDATI